MAHQMIETNVRRASINKAKTAEQSGRNERKQKVKRSFFLTDYRPSDPL